MFSVIFIPALSVAILNFQKIYDIEKNNAKEQLTLLAKLTATRQEQITNETREMLFLLSQLPQLRNPEPSSCQKFLVEILDQRKEYTDISLFDAEGNLICDGLETNRPVNFAYRPYFQKMLVEKNFVMGKYSIGAVSGKPTLPFIQPIFDSKGEIKSALAAYRDLSWLHNLNSSIFLPRETAFVVFDSDGAILDCYSDEECQKINTEDKILIQQILEKGGDGTISYKEPGETEKNYIFTSFSPDSSQDKIYIVIGRANNLPASVIFSGLLSSFVLLLVIAILAWYIAKRECVSCYLQNMKSDSVEK
jgi:hypothetical protein